MEKRPYDSLLACQKNGEVHQPGPKQDARDAFQENGHDAWGVRTLEVALFRVAALLSLTWDMSIQWP